MKTCCIYADVVCDFPKGNECELALLRDNYALSFPKYPSMWVDKGWLMGVWVIGNLYARKTNYYGAYPHRFLDRVRSMFPERKKVLHLFAGVVEPLDNEITLDIRPELLPMVVADAHDLLPFSDSTFDLVLADPPYTPKDAEHYGTKGVNRAKVMRNLRPSVIPGGYLCWLDTVRPMYRRQDWKQVGAIAVLVSTNTRVRCLSIFKAV